MNETNKIRLLYRKNLLRSPLDSLRVYVRSEKTIGRSTRCAFVRFPQRPHHTRSVASWLERYEPRQTPVTPVDPRRPQTTVAGLAHRQRRERTRVSLDRFTRDVVDQEGDCHVYSFLRPLWPLSPPPPFYPPRRGPPASPFIPEL